MKSYRYTFFLLHFGDIIECQTQQFHFLKESRQFLFDEFFAVQCQDAVGGIGRHEVAYPPLVVDNLSLLEVLEGSHDRVGIHTQLDGHIAHTRHPLLGRQFAIHDALTQRVGNLLIYRFLFLKVHFCQF